MNIEKENSATMKRLRISLGRSCFMLPILSIGFALLGYYYGLNTEECWYSISATYFTTASVIMSSLLIMTSKYFISYKGYGIGDRILSITSAVSAFSIVIFPCDCADWDRKRMLLPFVTREISNIIHCTSAGILFISFALMISFQFTKSYNTKDIKNPFKSYLINHKNTYAENSILLPNKIKRNKIYYRCAFVITLFMISQVVTSILGIKWMTIVNEAFMLWAFSLAWLVKGGAFKKLND